MPADRFSMPRSGLGVTLTRSVSWHLRTNRGYFARKGIPLNSSFPTKTVPELIAYAKEHPGQLSMASPARGSIMIHRHALQDHLAAIPAIL